MAILLEFPRPKQQRRCAECGGLFVPRERFHRMCLQCFRGARAVEALLTANRLWNELMDDRR